MKICRNFVKLLQKMLEIDEKYRPFAKIPEFREIGKFASGFGENFHFLFHFFIRVLTGYAAGCAAGCCARESYEPLALQAAAQPAGLHRRGLGAERRGAAERVASWQLQG